MRHAVDFHRLPLRRQYDDRQHTAIELDDSVMTGLRRMARRRGDLVVAALPLGLLLAAAPPAIAAGCAFEPQGEGRVVEIIDARSVRLEDGREVRLAGIEPVAAEQAGHTSALSAILKGHDVTLRG